ncbi:MAG TPA: ferredoxin [Solirubrobacteraceae bacterium]|nr:ferredoxin [Solirubrobacteraceae bacterium]
MTYLAVVDESACLAHGDCEELAPDVFRVQDVATVIGTAPLEQLISIAERCPASAISVIDEETGEPMYP